MEEFDWEARMRTVVDIANQGLKTALKTFAGQNGFSWSRKFYERTMTDLSQRIWLEKRGPSFNFYIYFLLGEGAHLRTNKYDGDADYLPGHFSGRHPEHARLTNPGQYLDDPFELESYVHKTLAFLEVDVLPVLDHIQSQDALIDCMVDYKKWRPLGVFAYMSTYDKLTVPRPIVD